jgi:hypothetical protein
MAVPFVLYLPQKCAELFAFFNLVIFFLDIDSYAAPDKLFFRRGTACRALTPLKQSGMQ